MSRKKASFSQLIDYIYAGASSQRFTCYHNTTERHAEGLKREFETNSRHLRARKNGVSLYHEIISIKRAEHLSVEAQKEKLAQLVRSYLEARAPHQLAFGMIHDDHAEHLHFHLVISSNTVDSQERVRLSKKQFNDIQTHLERHVLTHYPELEQQAVFTPNLTPEQKQAKTEKARLSKKGAELKRRTGKTPERDQVKETLETIFATSTTPQDFTEAMNKAGFTFYQRGQYAGITDRDGRKYRFATLGLAEHWTTFDEKMRASMKQPNDTPKKAHSTQQNPASTVPIHSEMAQDTHETQANDTPKGREKTIIEEMVTDTVESAKDLLNDFTNFNAWESEQKRRLKEAKEWRERRAKTERHQHGQGQKPKS